MGFAGAGMFDSIGDIDVAGARRQLDMCIDAGVNLVDTANMYSAGASEEVLGEALDGGRRDKLMVATKVRFAMGEGANDAGLSRWHIIESVEASLRRLQADHIDLLQVHEWDGQTPLEETLSALDDLVRAGKVRYVGCSNYTAWQLVKAMGIADAARIRAVREPADPLHAAGARGRVRAAARGARPGAGHAGLEPDRRRAAVGQVPPRPGRPRGLTPPGRLGRAAGPRPRGAVRPRRGPGGGRRRPRRLGRPGHAGVADGPARRSPR